MELIPWQVANQFQDSAYELQEHTRRLDGEPFRKLLQSTTTPQRRLTGLQLLTASFLPLTPRPKRLRERSRRVSFGPGYVGKKKKKRQKNNKTEKDARSEMRRVM